MRYRIRHITQYHYSDAVTLCRNEGCLLPRSTDWQQCHHAELQINPDPADLSEHQDFFGNRKSHFAIQDAHEKLTVTATSDVEVEPQRSQPLEESPPWEEVVRTMTEDRSPPMVAALPYLYPSPLIPLLPSVEEYARLSFTAKLPILVAVADLNRRIYDEFAYDPESTTITTPLMEVMKQRRGVCQDFAHLAIGCLRTVGLAARYVSGYIETLPPPGQERLIGADASHAWFSVYVPGSGWFDFDPTNNQRPVDQHITVAWGRDFADVSPLKGIAMGGGEHRVLVSVDVARQS